MPLNKPMETYPMYDHLTPAEAKLQILADLFGVTQIDVAAGIVLILAVCALDLLWRWKRRRG